LKNRLIRFTATAQEHVRRENAWWLANRDNTGVFAEELEQALKIVATLPGLDPVRWTSSGRMCAAYRRVASRSAAKGRHARNRLKQSRLR
jgi:hypothetical protein